MVATDSSGTEMAELLPLLAEFGPWVLVMAAVLGGAALEWWVWGTTYHREVREKEYWREKALTNLGLAESSVEAAADAVIGDSP